MIGWSIKRAKECTLIDRVVVSTDDHEIANIAKFYGAEVPFMRPVELAKDNSPEWLVWQHALKKVNELDGFGTDYLMVLPPTSPFRSDEDIGKGLELLHEDNTNIVISVTRSNRNPYFNMVELDSEGSAYLSKVPEKKVFRRQDATQVYDMTTSIYAAHADFVLNANGIFDGRVRALMIPELRALDIDTELDFKFAEFIISEGLVDTNEKDI